MMKRTVLLFTMALATLVLAQNGPRPVIVTEGRGVAESADNRKAEFSFRAAKFVREGNVRVEGRLEFGQAKGEKARRVGITMQGVRELGAKERNAEFAGPGVLTALNNAGKLERIEGRVVVNVQDNKKPEGTGDADKIRIRFKAAKSDLVFEFGGTVKRGDISVVINRDGGSTGGGTAGGTTGGTTGG
jgi:hypothetical protein